MIARSVFLICLLIIIGSNQQKPPCPAGQFYSSDNCQKCDPCYDIWNASIKSDNNTIQIGDSNTLDFHKLGTNIDKIEVWLRHNFAKLAMLKTSKTRLLSQLKFVQSMQKKARTDADTATAENNKYADRMKLKKEELRHLGNDMMALKAEAESKPAADNSGYFRQMNKAESEAKRAAGEEKQAIDNMHPLKDLCNVLRDDDFKESLMKRVTLDQDILLALKNKYNGALFTLGTEISCKNKICARNYTCRVCKDFKTCYDNDMLKIADNIIKRKLKNLTIQADNTQSSIPSFEFELNRIETQKALIDDVIGKTKPWNIKNIVEKILNLNAFNLSIYIAQPTFSRDDSFIKNLANDLKSVRVNCSSYATIDFLNKSGKLLNNSIILGEDIKFITETIRRVKNILSGANDTDILEKNTFQYFLLELSDIFDEIDGQVDKIFFKKRRIEDKFTKLAKLNADIDDMFDDMLNSSHQAKQKSMEINAKVINEYDELLKRIPKNLNEKFKSRSDVMDGFWPRMRVLLNKSEDLVDKIKTHVPDYSGYDYAVHYLESTIGVSLQELEEILDTATNKSIVYDKC